jgi:hypothetical protein
MRFREWFSDRSDRPGQNPSPAGPDDAGLNGMREECEALLAAGDEAINRALSGNSEAFLAATRQEGGE